MSTAHASLVGRVALVTGASSGIGHATALALARQGADLVVTARRAERLAALCQQISTLGCRALAVVGDAAEEATAQQAVGLALSSLGRLDILINNAGIGDYKPFVETSAAEYDALLNTNLRSGFLFTRHAVPSMIQQGSGTVIFVSSVAGLQGAAGEAVYSATKFAQVGLAQSLDAELRKHNIKVSVVCPGGVKSEFALGHGRTQEFIDNSRMMEPSEVAGSVVYVCTQPPNVRIPQLIVRHMG
ncbi:MAG: SDR family oxidoreductase [Acidobacteriota bacterium]|nr:SDR family oxidoreductase [Acidobacteriota bacterium]